MSEALFGTNSPMWTIDPSPGFTVQMPMAVGSRQIGTPPIGSPQGLSGSGLATTFPFAPSPPAVLVGPLGPFNAYGPINPGHVVGTEAMAGMTATSLLAAVAMRRGQPQGPSNDQEVEDFIYDALDLLPGAADVEVRCDAGRVTLTGSVQHKRVKRDVGEIAWAIPAVNDVQNNVTITSRRRTRAANREADAAPTASTRKQG